MIVRHIHTIGCLVIVYVYLVQSLILVLSFSIIYCDKHRVQVANSSFGRCLHKSCIFTLCHSA